ncbi:hypothetical protein [Kitasatospora sp. NPDC058046]|uniref:hypothetical protein n=1 Tax=Kitasatospora sp. NPDC058046 TaxID=3346312 RepID=UPI0036D9C5E8
MNNEEQGPPAGGSVGRDLTATGARLPAPSAAGPGRRRRRKIVFASELADDLAPVVRELAEALRLLAGQLETSMTAYAASLHRSTSTLSRYFSGLELPSADFVERLMDDAELHSGTPMSVEAREAVRRVHREAQSHAAPRTAELQGLRDQVNVAHLRAEAAVRTVRMLEAALEEAQAQVRRGELEARRAVHDLHVQSARHGVELDRAREHSERTQAEHDRLNAYIAQLEHALASARERASEAEARQVEAELRLERAEEHAEARHRDEASHLRQALRLAQQNQAEAEHRARQSAAEIAHLRARNGGRTEPPPVDGDPREAADTAASVVGGVGRQQAVAGVPGAGNWSWLGRIRGGVQTVGTAGRPSRRTTRAEDSAKRGTRQEVRRSEAVRSAVSRLARYRTTERGETLWIDNDVEREVARHQAAGDWGKGAAVLVAFGRGMAAEGYWEEAAEAVDRAVALYEGAGASAAAAECLASFARELEAAGAHQHAEVVAARSAALYQRADTRTVGKASDDEPFLRPYVDPERF